MSNPLSMTQRILLAAFVLVLDLALFFFPVTAVVLAYVIIYNPPWFKELIQRLDQPGPH